MWAVVALFAAIIAAPAAFGEEQTAGQLFVQAFDKKDDKAMKEIIKVHAAEVPGEVKDMVEYAMSPEANPQAKEFIINVAGLMAKIYADQTGDARLLAAVQTNYEKLQAGSKPKAAPALEAAAVEQAKKDIAGLSAGQWRVLSVALDEEGALQVEIDVKEAAEGDLTPKIDFKKSQEVKSMVMKKFPAFKKGRISWSGMGVGLKTLFLE
jgi:hypothetical protein